MEKHTRTSHPSYPKSSLVSPSNSPSSYGTISTKEPIFGVVPMPPKRERNRAVSPQSPGAARQYPKNGIFEKISLFFRQLRSSKPQPSVRTSPLPRLPGYDPQDDSDIRDKIAELVYGIDEHVQNFYDLTKDRDSATTMGDQNLLQARTRGATIRRRIAMAMLSRINSEGDPEETFLPKQVVEMMRIATRLEGRPQQEHSVHPAALSQWRVLTAFLIRLRYIEEGEFYIDGYEHQRRTNIENIVSQINSDLQPYILTRSSKNQRNDLKKIMEDSANIGLMIFQQRVGWGFGSWDEVRVHDSEGTTQDRIVVFPSVLQLSDGDGKSLPSPKTLRRSELEPRRSESRKHRKNVGR